MSQTSLDYRIVFSGLIHDDHAAPVLAVSAPSDEVVSELFSVLKQNYQRPEADPQAVQAIILMAGEQQVDHFRLSTGASLFLQAFLSVRREV